MRLPLFVLMVSALTVSALAWACRPDQRLRFREVSTESGLDEEKVGDYGVFWVDLDNDHRLDLVFMNHGHPPSLYQNLGTSFVNRLKGSGIKVDGWTYPQQDDRHGGACGDIDNDGDFDLAISHGAKEGATLGIKRDELLENLGDFHFRDIAEAAGTINTQGRGRMVSFVDLDLDGLIDLYLGNFVSNDVFYRNVDGKSFVDATAAAQLGLLEPTRQGFFDADLDGDLDLLAVPPQRFYRNDSGVFFEATAAAFTKTEMVADAWAFGRGDLDNDGDSDVVVIARSREGGRFENIGGRFERRPLALAPATGATLGDLDNDGDLDMVVTSNQRLRFFRNDGAQWQEEGVELPTLALGEGSEAALADFDGDGALDVALNGLERHVLLRNDNARHHFLKIRLRGTSSNRHGFGAKVKVSASGRQIAWAENLGGTSVFQSSGCAPLHFGLGRVRRVDVEISWPSGRTTRHIDIAADQEIELVESE